MEGARVEPGTVDCSAEPIVLFACQEAAALVIVFPLLEWVDVAPLLGYAAVTDDLLEQSSGESNVANDVCWLASIVRE